MKTQFKTVGLIGKNDLSGKKGYITKIVNFLEKQGSKVIYDPSVAKTLGKKKSWKREEIGKKSQLIIALGGDGTLLKVARVLDLQKPLVLSINLGTVGFLTEVKNLTKTMDALKDIYKGNYYIDERVLLRVTHYSKGKKRETFLALNDAVINQGNFARLIYLRAEIDQRKMIAFKADGLIVATPSGSTGHSLSAGGPIIHPMLPAFIFTPICPSELNNRPIVIPNTRQIKVIIETQRKYKDNAIGLTVDGQRTIPVHYGDEIKIRKSSRTLNLIRFGKSKYYKVLRDKLGWGKKFQ